MEEKIFNLADVADPKSKVCLLPEYSLIKRKFFELAKPISEQKYTTKKFYEDHIIPHMTEDNYISLRAGKVWCEFMMPQAIKLTSMMQVHQEAQDVVTILEREQEKVKKQFQIRQDVTDIMAAYIANLKAYIEDPDIQQKLSHEQYLKLYDIIRQEEDRAKTISLKERSEDRADAMFAFMVSQAKAGQLSEADIVMLEDDVRKDLLIFKGENGIYQLPTGSIPKIKFAAKALTAVTDQSAGQGA